MSFLQAEWRRLALVNYAVDPQVLLPYLPARTELDQWQGKHYVSLVGFLFQHTKVLGLKIPGHVNFPEVNLRFYVRHQHQGEWRRGVVFVKEIVPRAAITFIANTLYGEHYATHKMDYTWRDHGDHLETAYSWRHGSQWQSLQVKSDKQLAPIEVGSEAEFITEHYYGYTRLNAQKTTEYEVTHPRWDQYPVQSVEVKVDYGLVYGSDFAFLNDLEPTSVQLAEGSLITVEGKQRV